MSNLDKLKELRNALSCWQEDYDPTEDKEQYDMFGEAIDAVARLEAAERRIVEKDAVIAQRNAECERLIIEKALLRIKAAPGKPDYFIHRVEVCDSYGPDVELRAYSNSLDASKAKDDHGGEVIEVFTTPPAPSAPDGWIKCSDRMPLDSKDVTLFSPDLGVFNGYCGRGLKGVESESFYSSSGDHRDGVKPGVSHWMPLPAAPAPGGDDV